MENIRKNQKVKGYPLVFVGGFREMSGGLPLNEGRAVS
jgi:hypothetical protein